MKRLIRILTVLLIPFFLFGAYHSVRSYVMGRASLNWPATSGRIVEATTTEMPNAGDVHNGTTTYEVFVKYRYSVENAEYESTALSFPAPMQFRTKQDADDYRSIYQVNDAVEVFYNPETPSESCLEKGTIGIVYTLGCLLMMMLLAGLCVYGFRILTPEEVENA